MTYIYFGTLRLLYKAKLTFYLFTKLEQHLLEGIHIFALAMLTQIVCLFTHCDLGFRGCHFVHFHPF